MALPLIPVIKLIALGSLKIVFLLVGALFFPVFALRMILTGASSMLLPVLDWLESHKRLDASRHQSIVSDIEALAEIRYTRSEARHLLFGLLAKTLGNMSRSLLSAPKQFIRWVSGAWSQGTR